MPRAREEDFSGIVLEEVFGAGASKFAARVVRIVPGVGTGKFTGRVVVIVREVGTSKSVAIVFEMVSRARAATGTKQYFGAYADPSLKSLVIILSSKLIF